MSNPWTQLPPILLLSVCLGLIVWVALDRPQLLAVITYHREARDELLDRNRTLRDSNRALGVRAADLLAELKTWEEERNQDIDAFLKGLPKHPGYAPRFEFHRFDPPMLACWCERTADLSSSQVVTRISFDAVDFVVNGRRYRGWKRNGWILAPEEIQ